MYDCIFQAIQDGGLRFTNIYFRISPFIYQMKLGHRYVFTSHTSKKPIEILSCEI